MPNTTVAQTFFYDDVNIDATRLNEGDDGVLLEGRAKDELSDGPASLDNNELPNS